MIIRDGVRLITLAGPPGVGKTRLAIEAVARIAPRIKISTHMVDLSPLTDPALALSSIARALGQDDERITAMEWVKRSIRDQPVLLILDNVEQLLPRFSLELADLLAHCPLLTVIVTSREELHVRGERVFPVLPLALPDSSNAMDIAAARRSPAIMLFVMRAREVAPEFALTPSNAAAVATICTHLDGLPLAIELAAARISLFPPDGILARLERPLDLLTDGARDLPARHRTLRSAIEWSYDLLAPAEQALMRCLGIFSGGCTMEAATTVCGPEDNAVDVLTSLVRKNLVRIDRPGDAHQGDPGDFQSRVILLETIHEYALEQLARHPHERSALHERHATYYLQIAEQVAANIMNPEQFANFDLLERENDNLRTALQWMVADAPDPEPAIRLTKALTWYWYSRGYLNEGWYWLERVQQREAEAQPAMRASVRTCLTAIALRRGDFARALEDALTAVALLRTTEDREDLSHALGLAGQAALGLNELDEAEQLINEALAIARAIGHPWHTGGALWELSLVALRRGNLVRASELALEVFNLWSEMGDKQGTVLTMDVLSAAARGTGDLNRSRQIDEESLSIRRELGDTPGIGVSLRGLAEVALLRHQDSRARSLYGESLGIAVDVGDLLGVATCLEGLATIAVRHNRLERAATLLGAVEQARAQGGFLPAPVAPEVAQNIEAVRENLSADAFARAWDAGRTQPLDITVTSARTHLVSHVSVAKRGERTVMPSPTPLSPRERQVTALIAQGYDNAQIAAELILSKRTIETHVSNILRKLDLDSRVQIVLWATDHGLAADGTA